MSGPRAHSLIVDLVVTRLQAAPELDGVLVARARTRPVGPSVDRAVTVRKAVANPKRGAIQGAPVDWSTFVAIECRARAEDNQAPDEASDELHALVHAALMTDPSFGGAVEDLLPPQLRWDEDDADTAIGFTTAIYEVRHRTDEALNSWS